MSLRMNLYRAALRLVRKYAEKRRYSASLHEVPRAEREFQRVPESSSVRGWFHAASVGELEVLWPVIAEWAGTSRDHEVIVTIFSSSAEKAVKRLGEELISKGCKVAFCGYSPWEGSWEQAFAVLKPSFFMTAKYEAWPEMWAALQHLAIPLVIVGAVARRSLKTARAICVLLGERLPKMLLLPVGPESEGGLRRIFPDAQIRVCGEPRWDRVHERLKKGNSRVQELVQQASAFPRPWGILGSAWTEDLTFWGQHLTDVPGSLWVVPHRIDPAYVAALEDQLRAYGLLPRKSSAHENRERDSVGRQCWLVDEIGFLSELYRLADWVYVGGGFGEGVHSTIEPALHGVPIAIGPKGAERFPEVGQLAETGQLCVLRSDEQLESWIKGPMMLSNQRLDTWKNQAKERLGATARVLLALQDFVSRGENVLI